MIECIGVGQAPAITEIGRNEVVLADGERVRFDLAMIVPRHVAPRVVAESELANPQNGFAQPRNGKYGDFRSAKYDDVYVVGDVAHPNVPVGMAGVVFHSYLDHVVSMMLQDLIGTCSFDVGGFGVLGVCDFTRFVRGEAPYPSCTMVLGSRLARLAKRFFEDLYARGTGLWSIFLSWRGGVTAASSGVRVEEVRRVREMVEDLYEKVGPVLRLLDELAHLMASEEFFSVVAPALAARRSRG